MSEVAMKIALFLFVILWAPRTTSSAITITKELHVSNGLPWGAWGQIAFCPDGSWAVGFRLKVEKPCDDCDDTALNAIQLKCASSTKISKVISSLGGDWGDWGAWKECHQYGFNFFLTKFRLDVEPKQGDGDDTAANNLSMECRKKNTYSGSGNLMADTVAPWGYWKDWSSSCPLGSAICGISTKVEPQQGKGDDTALNDVIMYCCA